MTCHDIVKEYLKVNGYDGLANPGLECGCGLEDFRPCCEFGMDCEPGYKQVREVDGIMEEGWFPEKLGDGYENETKEVTK